MKKSMLSLAVVLVLSASTLSASAAVNGTNPRPQAVSGTNPRPQAVNGTNPRPQVGFSNMMQAMMAYFGM